jgi:hypothetical protein
MEERHDARLYGTVVLFVSSEEPIQHTELKTSNPIQSKIKSNQQSKINIIIIEKK